MFNRGSQQWLPHSFLCLMKTDFSEQVEQLRREITTAIKAVLQEHGRTEIDFPDTVDAVYVIWFDNDGDPYVCMVRKVQCFGDNIRLVVEDKYSHDLYEIDGPFEFGARCINWLDDILWTTVQFLSDSNINPLK